MATQFAETACFTMFRFGMGATSLGILNLDLLAWSQVNLMQGIRIIFCLDLFVLDTTGTRGAYGTSKKLG